MPPSFARFIGRKIIRSFLTIHGLAAFALITVVVMVKKFGVARRVIHPLIRAQIVRCGLNLLPMIFFLALVLGFAVIGQAVMLLQKLGTTDYLGTAMVGAVVRELGPLLTAFLVLARTGTANVIELGTARALGQVEALEALDIDPVHYFVVPRVVGLALGIFSLTVYLILGALGSGYLWAFLQNVPLRPDEYFRQLAGALTVLDFVLLTFKTLGFGAIIAVVTCFHGLARPLRIEEVSNATVRAVAQSLLLCVLLDVVCLVIYYFPLLLK
jgi:phospholipid/cholesterol/gamma-HCH transport system permease protein